MNHFVGKYEVMFVNNEKKIIDIKEHWKTARGVTLYFIDTDKVIYNWMVIISIKKVEN